MVPPCGEDVNQHHIYIHGILTSAHMYTYRIYIYIYTYIYTLQYNMYSICEPKQSLKGLLGGDEKLGAVGVGAAICHGQKTLVPELRAQVLPRGGRVSGFGV